MCARMRHFALSAIGRDRPGIVAAVTEVLLAHAVNIEDSHATILRGHFTMMLVVAAPEDAELERLRADLTAVRDRLELEALAVVLMIDVLGYGGGAVGVDGSRGAGAGDADARRTDQANTDHENSGQTSTVPQRLLDSRDAPVQLARGPHRHAPDSVVRSERAIHPARCSRHADPQRIRRNRDLERRGQRRIRRWNRRRRGA